MDAPTTTHIGHFHGEPRGPPAHHPRDEALVSELQRLRVENARLKQEASLGSSGPQLASAEGIVHAMLGEIGHLRGQPTIALDIFQKRAELPDLKKGIMSLTRSGWPLGACVRLPSLRPVSCRLTPVTQTLANFVKSSKEHLGEIREHREDQLTTMALISDDPGPIKEATFRLINLLAHASTLPCSDERSALRKSKSGLRTRRGLDQFRMNLALIIEYVRLVDVEYAVCQNLGFHPCVMLRCIVCMCVGVHGSQRRSCLHNF